MPTSATIARMKSAPSTTIVTGVLRSYRTAADGVGSDVEIEVLRNESPDGARDFIKPEPGKILHAFHGETASRSAAQKIGRKVRVRLTFLGGPFGGRAVIEQLDDE